MYAESDENQPLIDYIELKNILYILCGYWWWRKTATIGVLSKKCRYFNYLAFNVLSWDV